MYGRGRSIHKSMVKFSGFKLKKPRLIGDYYGKAAERGISPVRGKVPSQ